MSMDEQYKEMRAFAKSLDAFNTQLQTSWKDLEQKHEAVSPLWQDTFRKQYDTEWSAFKESMERYLRHDVPKYSRFLREKMEYLRRFLYGN